MARTPAYISWAKMKMRCNNPNHASYKWYGAVGISYDARWESYAEFYSDMGDRPEGTQLDRINPNDHYHKDNCRWAPVEEAAQNRTTTRLTACKVRLIKGLLRSIKPDTPMAVAHNCIANLFGVTRYMIWTIAAEKCWAKVP